MEGITCRRQLYSLPSHLGLIGALPWQVPPDVPSELERNRRFDVERPFGHNGVVAIEGVRR
jgi:hypothetical protein